MLSDYSIGVSTVALRGVNAKDYPDAMLPANVFKIRYNFIIVDITLVTDTV